MRRLRAVPLVGWFAYPPLLVVLAVVVAVVMGAGQVLGAPSLVWHYSWFAQLTAGVGLSLLCVSLGMVGYLLDSIENPDQTVALDKATFGSVSRYVLWPVGTLMAAVALASPLRENASYHGGFVWLGVGAVVVGLAWLARGRFSKVEIAAPLPARFRERMRTWLDRLLSKPWTPEATDFDYGAHAVQAALMVVLGALYAAVWFGRRSAPAAFAVCVALAMLMGVWGLLRFWLRRFRVVGMLFLAWLACLIGLTRDLPVTGFAGLSFPDPAKSSGTLLKEDVVLNAWRDRVDPTKGQRPQPLVVVATSGGAARAAVWTINVLRGLDERLPGFLGHVRIITGASGGMVGAAHLVSALGEGGLAVPIDEVLEGAGRDSLSAVTRALILPFDDRGQALEQAWEGNAPRLATLRFRDLAAGERAGWRPSLVYAPMLVEDGRRLLISNLDLDDLTGTWAPSVGCTSTTTPDKLCLQAHSALQLFAFEGQGIDQVRLSTVARLSATFPWVTSAARLTTKKDRRVVDAGYYDNYGVDLATMWIRKNADWLRKNTSGVLLIQIRDGHRDGPPGAEDGPGIAAGWVSAFTTPISGILEAREATMSYRNDEQIALLAADPRLAPGKDFFVTKSFEFSGGAPLQWYLSREALDALKRPLDGELITGELEKWWAARIAGIGSQPTAALPPP